MGFGKFFGKEAQGELPAGHVGPLDKDGSLRFPGRPEPQEEDSAEVVEYQKMVTARVKEHFQEKGVTATGFLNRANFEKNLTTLTTDLNLNYNTVHTAIRQLAAQERLLREEKERRAA